MPFTTTLRNERFTFADLREVLAKANEEKSGDQLAGVATRHERERVAAKLSLAEITLGEIVDTPLIDPATDEVSRALLADLDREAFAPLRGMTVGAFREFLLADDTSGETLRLLHRGIPPEAAAAVAKLMGNVARLFDPFLVNSVVGFIGPEYLYDERQIIRAGLEDHFMGKLLGLPMGVDVCYTNHAAADQNSSDNLLLLLATAGVNYVMGVSCADDVRLNYQSTSFHDGASVRQLLGLRPAPEFAAWLSEAGIWRDGRLLAGRDRLLASLPALLE